MQPVTIYTISAIDEPYNMSNMTIKHIRVIILYALNMIMIRRPSKQLAGIGKITHSQTPRFSFENTDRVTL